MTEDASTTEGSAATAQPVGNGMRGFETVGAFLEEDDWHPQRLEDRTIYRVYFSGHHGDLRCYAQVRTDLEQFLFYVIAPVKAPEPDRPAVAEYLTRANYGLRIGNFEMDYNDGEVRYKSSLDFEAAELNGALIKNTIYPAVHTMDHYLPGLLSVMYGHQAPAEAIEEIEN
jgi:hypothetical protein